MSGIWWEHGMPFDATGGFAVSIWVMDAEEWREKLLQCEIEN